MTLKRALLRLVCAACAIYVAFLVVLFFYQRVILYPGVNNRVAATPPAVADLEVIRMATPAGDVESLFLPAWAGSNLPEPVVIFAHGNGEVTDWWTSALDGFRERGIGVLLVEYPGYGRSTGTPSEAAIRVAMDAAYDRLASDSRIDRTRIFGFGLSLGGGAICLLARDRPLRALILESTFPSLDIFTAHYWAPPFLLRDHFDNLTAVKQFPGPVLVIHGSRDRLIPWAEGRRLAAASAHSTFKLYDCSHGCWHPDRVPFWQDAEPFLANAGILSHALDGEKQHVP